MKTISVKASHPYTVTVGSGLLPSIGAMLSEVVAASCRICIISDDHVYPLYGECVRCALEAAGFSVCAYVIPHGERSKCLTVYGDILNFLAKEHFSRTDCLAALGGGVVGDLCGFCAATFLRGIPYIQIPTSLLAMVDSSVGGKTAVDLPAGKNLCGAFYPPCAVYCDTAALDTLPSEFFADGMAEVIKYGVLFDAELLQLLERDGCAFDREEVIARCIDHKRRAVEADERDCGVRQLLNFGHTAAHGIEQHSNYTVTHGCAVAAGMCIITRAAECCGLIKTPFSPMLQALLTKFSLPTDTDIPASEMSEAIRSDKKRDGGIIRLVIADTPGHAFLHSCPASECTAFLSCGIGAPEQR